MTQTTTMKDTACLIQHLLSSSSPAVVTVTVKVTLYLMLAALWFDSVSSSFCARVFQRMESALPKRVSPVRGG